LKRKTLDEAKEDTKKALQKQERTGVYKGLFTFQLPSRLQKLQKAIAEDEEQDEVEESGISEEEISEIEKLVDKVLSRMVDVLEEGEIEKFLRFIREQNQMIEYIKTIIDLREQAKKPSIESLILVLNRSKEDSLIWKEETIIYSPSKVKLENIKIVRS